MQPVRLGYRCTAARLHHLIDEHQCVSGFIGWKYRRTLLTKTSPISRESGNHCKRCLLMLSCWFCTTARILSHCVSAANHAVCGLCGGSSRLLHCHETDSHTIRAPRVHNGCTWARIESVTQQQVVAQAPQVCWFKFLSSHLYVASRLIPPFSWQYKRYSPALASRNFCSRPHHHFHVLSSSFAHHCRILMLVFFLSSISLLRYLHLLRVISSGRNHQQHVSPISTNVWAMHRQHLGLFLLSAALCPTEHNHRPLAIGRPGELKHRSGPTPKQGRCLGTPHPG